MHRPLAPLTGSWLLRPAGAMALAVPFVPFTAGGGAAWPEESEPQHTTPPE